MDEEADVLLVLGLYRDGMREFVGGAAQSVAKFLGLDFVPRGELIERQSGLLEHPVGELCLLGAEAVGLNVAVGDEPAHGEPSGYN